MVRVTQPSGGNTKLEEADASTVKTVRVLKPPGGGSSISFGEPDEPVVAPKGRQQPKTSPFATEETPAPVEQKSENGSSEAAPAAEAESAPEKISEEAESPSKIEKEETKQNEAPPTKEKESPVYQQQPPTRVRQPPGGFSTALW